MTSVLAGADRPVSAAALDTLRARLAGSVITPDDAAFTAATRVWNAAKDARPRLVVRCANGSDVVAAVRFARDQELPVTVRAGGWHPAGHGTGRGVVVDLRPMSRVLVDPLGGTALVGGGATWGAVDAATQDADRGVPGLSWPAVGVAGSTLGGGFGEFRRAYGLVCDNLVGADLVLADGSHVTTSGDELPELLWGLRGGGGNFGVATALRFRLRPLPRPVLAGTVWFAADSAGTLLRWYRDWTAGLPAEVSTRLSLYAAGHPAVPDHLAGTPVAAVFAASLATPPYALLDVAPIRGAAPVLADGLMARPTVAGPPNGGTRPGASAAVDSWYLAALVDDVVDALLARHEAMPPGAAELHVHHLGAAVARVGGMSTAAPHRSVPYLVTGQVAWRAARQAESARGWLADTATSLASRAVGGPHPGFCSESRPSTEVYGTERYLRLAALKRRFDPDNVFAGNQNVRPLA